MTASPIPDTPVRTNPAPPVGARPRVSVVIPVLGDLEALGRLLPALRAEPSPVDEILVVDGAGSAECRHLVEQHGGVYLSTRAGRGHQLHAGALRARGDCLWFLHADATPPPGGAEQIRRQADDCLGGFFRFRFTGRPTWYKRLLAWGTNWRARIGVPYGDQGIFVRRAAYAAAGGFADLPLFEEVGLVRALRRQGRLRALDTPIGVSPRRWERDGWIRRTVENRLLALGFALGVNPARLARRYRPAPGSARPDAGGGTC